MKNSLFQVSKTALFALFFFAFGAGLFGQAPLIEWQNTIGGSITDHLQSGQQTTDGGYILCGHSDSPLSGDKTEASQGTYDYWVVKVDATGNIQWQNTIGGSADDVSPSVQQTTDGGYILCGVSASPLSGDKTENLIGSQDFWVLKIDASGAIVWQNTIGGNNTEFGGIVQQTSDGGYIVGGTSASPISGDKTENPLGQNDFWVIKLNATGVVQWDNTIGGGLDDFLISLQQTSDGGYVLGGWSNSPISGDKTEACQGMPDYWVVKINASGTVVWDKTIGGNDDDRLHAIRQTADDGYILAGYSVSNISGDKSENSLGNRDYWVVKLNPSGAIVWQNTIGGSNIDIPNTISQTSDSGYLIAGESDSNISGDKNENSNGAADFWIIKLGGTGNILWQNTIGGNSTDIVNFAQQTSDGGYFLGGNSFSNISGDKTENSNGVTDYWVVKLASPAEALDFDGIDDQITLDPLPVSTDFTLEYWLYAKTPDDGYDRITSTVGDVFETAKSGTGVIRLHTSPTGWQTVTSVPVDEWTHLAFVKNGTSMKIFNNGLLATDIYTLLPELPSQFYLGARWVGNDGAAGIEAANMDLDELRVWNVARTQAEIVANMNCPLETPPTSIPNLVVYYNMNQGYAGGDNAGLTTLIDSSGNQLHGTLQNFALNGPVSNFVVPGPTLSCPTSDLDGDGFTTAAGDCNDFNGAVFPGAFELCNNNTDDDCDGLVDETAPTVTFTYTKPTCSYSTNGKIKVNPTAPVTGYTYAWSHGATTREITNVTAGTYTITVTKTATGCSVVGTAMLTAPAEVIVNLTVTNILCFGQTIGSIKGLASGGTGTKTYLWSNGATSATISNLAAGTYSVTATDSKGCTGANSGTVVEPTEVVLSHSVQLLTNGKYKITLSATGGTPYTTGLSHRYCKVSVTNVCGFSSTVVYSNLLPGTMHTFRARDLKNCLDEITVTLPGNSSTAKDEGGTTFENLQNWKVRGSFDLAPNPARNAVQIIFSEKTPAAGLLEIQNLDGKVLRSVSIESLAENSGWLSLENLPPGIFVVTLRAENSLPVTRKLVVD